MKTVGRIYGCFDDTSIWISHFISINDLLKSEQNAQIEDK